MSKDECEVHAHRRFNSPIENEVVTDTSTERKGGWFLFR